MSTPVFRYHGESVVLDTEEFAAETLSPILEHIIVETVMAYRVGMWKLHGQQLPPDSHTLRDFIGHWEAALLLKKTVRDRASLSRVTAQVGHSGIVCSKPH